MLVGLGQIVRAFSLFHARTNRFHGRPWNCWAVGRTGGKGIRWFGRDYYFCFRQSHGVTGPRSAHRPSLPFRGDSSAADNSRSRGAYCRYNHARPSRTSSTLTFHPPRRMIPSVRPYLFPPMRLSYPLLTRRVAYWFDPKQNTLSRADRSLGLAPSVRNKEPTPEENQRLIGGQLRAFRVLAPTR